MGEMVDNRSEAEVCADLAAYWNSQERAEFEKRRLAAILAELDAAVTKAEVE